VRARPAKLPAAPVFPVKDNIPTDRLPLVTLLLIAAGVAVHVVLGYGETLELLADVLFLWIFGPTVEDSMSRVRFLAFCLLGGLIAAGLRLALDPDATVAAVAAGGAVAAVLGGYLAWYRRARVVSLVLVPLLFSLFEVPAWILLALWLPLQAALAGWVALAAEAGGLVFGLLAMRAFAQRRKLHATPPSAVAALP
jgi:membrane associated rhomboid family serine protease